MFIKYCIIIFIGRNDCLFSVIPDSIRDHNSEKKFNVTISRESFIGFLSLNFLPFNMAIPIYTVEKSLTYIQFDIIIILKCNSNQIKGDLL